MAIITGTSLAEVGAANAAMVKAFAPRAKQAFYGKLCTTQVSTRPVEPYVTIGAVPSLSLYQGALNPRRIPSWRTNVPNPLFTRAVEIDRDDIEFDQTRWLISIATQFGIRLAQFPDQLIAARLLKGSTANSQYQTFKGTSYTMTFDAVPFFAATHANGNGSNQSNIVQGTLPNTDAGLATYDQARLANMMINDFMQVLATFSGFVDNTGQKIYDSIDSQLCDIVVPPSLLPIAQLAFQGGALGGQGGDNGSTGPTNNNVVPKRVRNIISSSYFAGMIDPESATDAALSPVNPTDFYVLLADEYVRPFYYQAYRPPQQGEVRGYQPTEAEGSLMSEYGLPADAAAAFSGAMIETTFGRVGANADAHTITQQAFLAAPRWRGNMFYGPWFTAIRVKPASGS